MTKQAIEMNVTEIPLPWAHRWGTVVDIEYPADRPNVVDLVFSHGTRTAETKTSLYGKRTDGKWDIARLIPASRKARA